MFVGARSIGERSCVGSAGGRDSLPGRVWYLLDPGGQGAEGHRDLLDAWRRGDFCTGLDAIARDFEQHHPNIAIAETQCGTGEQEFNEVLLARIAAGNPPDATVLWTSPAALAARGALLPLDALMQQARYAPAENWPPAVLASCRFAGKTYGLPVTRVRVVSGTTGICSSTRASPPGRDDFPKSWDELRRLSKEFTVWKGDTLEVAGFIPWHAVEDLATWSASNGSQLYDAAQRKYTIDAEPNVAMMEYAVDWLNQEYKGLRQGQPLRELGGLRDRGPAAGLHRPAPGDVFDLLVEHGPENLRPIRLCLEHGPTAGRSRWYQDRRGILAKLAGAPKGSRHVEQAFAWLDYMSGVGVQAWFRNFPDLPANLKVPRDLLPTALVDGKGKAFAQDIMHFSATSSTALRRCGIRRCKTSPRIRSDARSSRSCTRWRRPGTPWARRRRPARALDKVLQAGA